MGPIKTEPGLSNADVLKEGGGSKKKPTSHPRVRKGPLPAARNPLRLIKVGNEWHIHNTTFGEREVYQQLFGPEARAAGEGPRFNKPGLYWYATVQNFVDWITDDDGNAYTEEQFTEELIMQLIVLAREEFLAAQAVARNADLRRP